MLFIGKGCLVISSITIKSLIYFVEVQGYQTRYLSSGNLNLAPKLRALNLKNTKIRIKIEGIQTICTDGLLKPKLNELHRSIWSSAFIEFKSRDYCEISKPNTKAVFSFFSLSNLFYLFQTIRGEKCDRVVSVPLFEKSCFEIRLDGTLDCKYVVNFIDFKLFSISLLGSIIYFTANKLNNFVETNLRTSNRRSKLHRLYVFILYADVTIFVVWFTNLMNLKKYFI